MLIKHMIINENNTNRKPIFEKDRQVANCAEVWAARKAILKGNNFNDLSYYSIQASDGERKAFCDNCEHTF